MSVRKAQNRVRKQHGIGKTRLHQRMRANRDSLWVCCEAAWYGYSHADGEFRDETKRKMHALVDKLAADAIIAMAYRKAEDAERKAMKAREVTVVWHIP